VFYLLVGACSNPQHEPKAAPGFFSVLGVRLFAKKSEGKKRKEEKRELTGQGEEVVVKGEII
jgi:hypothetical protein